MTSLSRDERGLTDIGRFEERIYHTLTRRVDEILAGARRARVAHQIEIDVVVRAGNSVDIIEAKTGVQKAGIDQLDTVGTPTVWANTSSSSLSPAAFCPAPTRPWQPPRRSV